jgi:hypothetical protein
MKTYLDYTIEGKAGNWRAYRSYYVDGTLVNCPPIYRNTLKLLRDEIDTMVKAVQ